MSKARWITQRRPWRRSFNRSTARASPGNAPAADGKPRGCVFRVTAHRGAAVDLGGNSPDIGARAW